ncbi:response regulator transcription factor [Macrococcus brunensis]|uniref:Response regulator ArlR n=1 Tax=Macrococcus brunensis TaxID=198483 RepID=A0A4R6BGH9_9STAP|nr:response regulator transcription factor [Macrococcus brunensis]TDL98942.1 response regulator transcription factor [Macrococcus brunensis]
MNILLIEDDLRLGRMTKMLLEKKHHTVNWQADGADGLEYARAASPDILLIDWVLPTLSGLEIIAELRSERINTPIILLTAKGEIDDKLVGFIQGADDYITKPFDIEELNMRMMALNRRAEKRITSFITFGPLVLNTENGLITLDKQTLTLTHKEHLLLELLLHYQHGTISKELILDKIWQLDGDVSENAIEVLIGRLRKKINPVKIKASRNIGYQLSE